VACCWTDNGGVQMKWSTTGAAGLRLKMSTGCQQVLQQLVRVLGRPQTVPSCRCNIVK
jgi:hypothetical protein